MTFTETRCLIGTVLWNIEFNNETSSRTLTLRKKIICFNGSSSKVMKHAFYFILKALFILKIFKFLSWIFGRVGKTACLERQDRLIRFHSLYHLLPFAVTNCHCCHSLRFVVTRCHSISFAVTRCNTRCHSLCHSALLSLVVTCCHSIYHSSVFL